VAYQVSHKDPYLLTVATHKPEEVKDIAIPLSQECLFGVALRSKARQPIKVYKVELEINEPRFCKVNPAQVEQEETELDQGEVLQHVSLITGLQEAKEVEQFADISISWAKKSNETVTCLCKIPSCSMSIMDIPLRVRLKGFQESGWQVKRRDELIAIEYEIENRSEEPIENGLIELEVSDNFFCVGEFKTYLSIMPYEKYTLKYNLVATGIGRLLLPRIFIYQYTKVPKAHGEKAEEIEEREVLVGGCGKRILIVK